MSLARHPNQLFLALNGYACVRTVARCTLFDYATNDVIPPSPPKEEFRNCMFLERGIIVRTRAVTHHYLRFLRLFLRTFVNLFNMASCIRMCFNDCREK